MELALFDFDGTITRKDTFVDFMRFATPPLRRTWAEIRLLPALVGYGLGRLSTSAMRRRMVHVALRGRSEAQIRGSGERFAEQVIQTRLRTSAKRRIEWHRQRGDTVVVVSASLDVYLEAWCRMQALDLLCSRLEVEDGILTGRYRGADCCGEEKVRRVRERYDLARFDAIHAYGDTDEDLPMLDLATYRTFRGRKMER